jgi:hypothetical protein
MRDIRGDLQDRANLFEEQICAAEDQFDKLIEQLKREQETRLAGPLPYRARSQTLKTWPNLKERNLKAWLASNEPRMDTGLVSSV